MFAWLRRRPIGVLLGGALLLLLGPGCHILFPFESAQDAGNSASCKVERWQCGAKPGPARVDQPAGAPFQVVEGLNTDKGATYYPYRHPSTVAINSASPTVRGATLLQTGAGDWKLTTASYMAVQVLDPVEGLYVAYDARATTPPSWLTGAGPEGYSRLCPPPGGQGDPVSCGSLVLSIKDPTTKQNLRLDLWRRNEPPGGGPIILPGNKSGNPVFPTLPGFRQDIVDAAASGHR